MAGSQLDGGGPSMGGQRSAQNLLAEGEVDVHVLDLRHNIEVFLPAIVRSQGSGFLRRYHISKELGWIT